MEKRKIVAYYRVSTKRQGQSGLGLDAQQQAVAVYANGSGKIVAEYTEVETGKRSDRPKLAEAIARARAIRGVLVIAKLDRLARNVAFVSALMESGCEFVCCDMPEANRLTIHILAAVAEHEARLISERTKAALAQAKRRGVKLGTHRRGHRCDWRRGMEKGLKKARTVSAEQAAKRRDDCYSFLLDDVKVWRNAGESLRTIAQKLNTAGHVTTSGKAFGAMTVRRLLTS